ncbi:MAG TPA: pyridoxamine 5'-phosphate oxidase [Vicinamibacterales bacterium]|nr:pyridoxamine 5'-phosphate oxidase [Vicinamibacterales bacterium]
MTDPIDLFRELYDRAAITCAEPDAMVLSTVDADGRPSGRYVLLKAVDQRGFVFYTNLGSRKARALAANPVAALCFYWPPERQVRVEGRAEPVDDAEADAYFATRPRPFQVGAWASAQSDVLESRRLLDERVALADARFKDATVPRPPFWSGYRVVPDAIEFWTRDPARLHVRERYERTGSIWRLSTLYP